MYKLEDYLYVSLDNSKFKIEQTMVILMFDDQSLCRVDWCFILSYSWVPVVGKQTRLTTTKKHGEKNHKITNTELNWHGQKKTRNTGGRKQASHTKSRRDQVFPSGWTFFAETLTVFEKIMMTTIGFFSPSLREWVPCSFSSVLYLVSSEHLNACLCDIGLILPEEWI